MAALHGFMVVEAGHLSRLHEQQSRIVGEIEADRRRACLWPQNLSAFGVGGMRVPLGRRFWLEKATLSLSGCAGPATGSRLTPSLVIPTSDGEVRSMDVVPTSNMSAGGRR
jgi:hypothetical protein